MFYCQSCGHENRNDARYCFNCGTEITRARVRQERAPRVNQNDPNISAEIEQCRRILFSGIDSRHSMKSAIMTLKEYKQRGYSKAGQVLLEYSRFSRGNPALQRLASS